MNVDPFTIPLERPLETATGGLHRSRQGAFVTVAVDGERGLGEATPLPGWTESLEACRDALAAVEDPVAALREDAGVLADRPAARHGVALAIADARARAEPGPLYRALGGREHVESVPVNATVGDGSPEETARAVETAVEAGFPAVKVKVGARTVAADVERLRLASERATNSGENESDGSGTGGSETDGSGTGGSETGRSETGGSETGGSETPGDNVELRADANGAWTEAEAREAFDALRDVGVSYVEQPVPADSLAAAASLRDEFGPQGDYAGDEGRAVGVALDESVAAHGVEAVVAAGAADVVVCKPMVLGGPDRAREAAVAAREAGLDAVVTTTVDAAVARAGAAHVAASIPNVRACGLATGDLLAADVLADRVPVERGRMWLPRGPGTLGRQARGDGNGRQDDRRGTKNRREAKNRRGDCEGS